MVVVCSFAITSTDPRILLIFISPPPINSSKLRYIYSMIVNFIGSPSSSKTTTASLIFASLKEKGVPCEFLVEEARLTIAVKKFVNQTQELTLTDKDQLKIMYDQYFSLNAFNYSSPNSIIILDSSPLNALFYMTDSGKNQLRTDQFYQELLNKISSLIDLPFFCNTVPYTNDPNRIHSKEESERIHSLIKPILKEFVPKVFNSLVELDGAAKIRANFAIGKILEHYYLLNE